MTTKDNEWERILTKVAEDIFNEEEIRKLADILVEAFIWQHEHKDKEPEPYIPKARKRKVKNPQDFDPGQKFYL